MARFIEWTPDQIIQWNMFCADLPELPLANTRKYPPYNVYKLTTTGQICYIMSYFDDGTVRVGIPEEWNPDRWLTAGTQVFGINPEELVETELPC